MSVNSSNINSEIIDKVISLTARQVEKEITLSDLVKKLDDFTTEYLDKIEIIMRLEDEFSVQISDDEVDQIVYVEDFVKVIESKKLL